jgi:hypothetical protein
MEVPSRELERLSRAGKGLRMADQEPQHELMWEGSFNVCLSVQLVCKCLNKMCALLGVAGITLW